MLNFTGGVTTKPLGLTNTPLLSYGLKREVIFWQLIIAYRYVAEDQQWKVYEYQCTHLLSVLFIERCGQAASFQFIILHYTFFQAWRTAWPWKGYLAAAFVKHSIQRPKLGLYDKFTPSSLRWLSHTRTRLSKSPWGGRRSVSTFVKKKQAWVLSCLRLLAIIRLKIQYITLHHYDVFCALKDTQHQQQVVDMLQEFAFCIWMYIYG